jgi:hypothetical protein
MQIMGFNTWQGDMPTEPLIKQALKFSDDVEAAGIATLRSAWIAPAEKRMWCSWDTENLDGLQQAFDEMNDRTGLESQLTEVETFFP